MIDQFSQPLRSILGATARILSLLHIDARRQFRLAHRIYRGWFAALRLPTRSQRVLPDVLLIGVSKAGTSSIASYLGRHPDFYPPIYKEPHYFDLNADKDRAWYRAHFPHRARKWLITHLYRKNFVTADFTPSYYLMPDAPRRSVCELENPKIILSLRNPIERAYSHFRDSRSIGYEILDNFEDALKAEPVRLRGEHERMERDPAYCSEALMTFGYTTRGIYIDYIKQWRKFYPADRMLILDFDVWTRQPEDTYGTICDFLEIPRVRLRNFAPYNVNRHPHAPIDPDVRRKLANFFRPHNLALSEYLGIDFDWT